MADGDGSTGESEGLQVELFHPDSEREPGDTNIQGFGFDVHPVVFPVSALIIVLFVAVTILMGDSAAQAYTDIFNFINANFGWFYILAVNVFIGALLFFAFSKYGKIRIGGVEAETEFSTFSWVAMLFSAGMGIGLMFWSVAEPMWHLGTGGGNLFAAEPQTGEAAAAAMGVTFYHWGFHPWAIYGLVALGLAFFSFNRGLPLTFRSVFYPLLGDRIYGWPGHVIDLVTVFATIFGLGTSLGLGAQQINAGLSIVSETIAGSSLVPVNTGSQVAIIAVITLIATASVAAGLQRGVKRLSTINMYIMLIFLGFMLVAGPTLYLLDAVVQDVGFYLQNLAYMSFFTGSFTGDGVTGGYENWQHFWTIFYWGWWIAWSPFVGLFIARISKGRTVREMVLGVLMLPTAFSFVWLGTFGGAALYAQQVLGGTIFQTVTGDGPNTGNAYAMFEMLGSYPLTTLTSIVAVTLVVTFFVTSSDSGSLVVDHLTSGGKHDVPRTQRIFWALTEGAVAATLLVGGGLSALQTASITTGLPFAAILLLMVYTVYLGLSNEFEILQSEEFRERIGEISEER
ncbi:BCCT family transporter [Halobacteriaceae archaeon GCM10025711]